MQTADTPQFEEHIARLCAEFEQPLTKARKDAYWAGVAKMSLPAFIRCVDFAIGEEGPDTLPTAKGLWKIYGRLRAPLAPVQTYARDSGEDHIERWANRLLYAHLAGRGGVGSVNRQASAELEACLKLRRDLIAWFIEPIREADPDTTPAEFLRQWMAGLQEISHIEKATYARWCAMLEQPEMLEPFRPSMARELAA
jgi:hypothetical protein